MNAREEIHGLSHANVDMLERSAARAFVWLLTGPVAKADVVTDRNVTASDKSLPCINIALCVPKTSSECNAALESPKLAG
jgi:hypothetical protein